MMMMDLVCREITKKCKDIEVSNNVGVITAGLRSKKMQISNGQFNANLSLDAVRVFAIIKFFAILFFSILLLMLITFT